MCAFALSDSTHCDHLAGARKPQASSFGYNFRRSEAISPTWRRLGDALLVCTAEALVRIQAHCHARREGDEAESRMSCVGMLVFMARARLGRTKEQYAARDTNAQPVTASTINRLLTLLAIKALRRFRKRSEIILFPSGSKCAKYGRSTHLSGASTTRFVAEYTSTSGPRVHCAFERKGSTEIKMNRTHGESPGAEWFK